MSIKLFIIDTTGPMFKEYDSSKINWSKAPYHQLEKDGRLHNKTHKRIRSNFIEYINKIKELGYNAISFDDLAHLTSFKFYPDELRKKIFIYKKKLIRLFNIAKKEGLKIFLTTDVMFGNKYINKYTGLKNSRKVNMFKHVIIKAFQNFSQLDGMILRIGESDGVDVESDFKSGIFIKTPCQANKFIKEILPCFEKNNKLLIFRTWSTGINKIGDIMWNKKTFDTVFKNISSDYFIISLKYGNCDFFRHIKLNPFFNDDKHYKIIELQTRREYEGFGEYPSFIGWDYYEYHKKLITNEKIIGIHVWCQTGGWSGFKNYTFLKKSSFWNELNTAVTIKIFKENCTVENSVRSFYKGREIHKFIKFLKLSDYVIKNLLYDPTIYQNELFFNKIRIPPLIHIFWENFTLTNMIVMFYRKFSQDGSLSVKKGNKALKKIKKMADIALDLNLPYNSRFHYDTFKIFCQARKIIYRGYTKNRVRKIYSMIEEYKNNYKTRYHFHIMLKHKINKTLYFMIYKLLIRSKSRYRLLDKIIFNAFFSNILLFIYKLLKKNFPEFTGNQAMPLSSFIK